MFTFEKMRKNRPLTVLALFALAFWMPALNGIAQNQAVVDRLISNTIIYHTINDFSKSIPTGINAPGYYFLEDQGLALSENFYFQNWELMRSGDYYIKELTQIVNARFIPYIPEDSLMLVNVSQSGKPLFDIKLMRKGDTLVYMQTDGERSINKTVTVAGNHISSYDYFNAGGDISFKSILQGDTIRFEVFAEGKGNNKGRQNIYYERGLPYKFEVFDFSAGTYNLKSTEKCSFTEFYKPSFIETIGRKGKIEDSTHFYYEGNRLLKLSEMSGNKEKLQITYSYNRYGKYTGKVVRSSNKNYMIDISHAGASVSDVEIDDRSRDFRRHFAFKTGNQGVLSGIEYSTINRESLIETPRNTWSFAYNRLGNLQSVQVADAEGNVSKVVQFDYTFISGAR